MSEQTTAPAEPPRQGLTYLRVLELAHTLRAGQPVFLTDAEFTELFRAWLRLTDLEPHWQGGQADG